MYVSMYVCMYLSIYLSVGIPLYGDPRWHHFITRATKYKKKDNNNEIYAKAPRRKP